MDSSPLFSYPHRLPIIIAVAITGFAAVSRASPSSLADADAKAFVDLHNRARAEVGVGPVRWNASIAWYAKAYAARRAADCALEHSDGPYGECISQGGGEMSVADAVREWTDEKRFYNYERNECEGGEECRHYTSVVCRLTTDIGCARIKCRNGAGWFATCNYWPSYDGQRPY
ncbi:unnamed protein product [Cuscuta campestris]|uniref:SCP domain-containing protein n=1 Tax=Cuscuta campestris TaxID=132261 RepID=A0A484KBC4_9ASTE|nr:unnamed protein product [Cuscuta campestris]